MNQSEKWLAALPAYNEVDSVAGVIEEVGTTLTFLLLMTDPLMERQMYWLLAMG